MPDDKRKMVKITQKKMPLGKYLSTHWDLYLLLLPGILLTLLFRYVPMYGLVIAFQNFNIFKGFSKSPFVGLANFQKLLGDSYFYTALKNSFLISFYKLVFTFPLPILLAIMIFEVRNTAFKRVVQTLVYLPHFLSWAVVYGIFYSILSLNGIWNDITDFLGFGRISYFITPSVFRGTLVLTDAWKEVGWGCIIYLAALTAIDPCLYEAARIDGAGKIQQILHVTLPGIASTIVVMLVLRLGSLLSAGFDQIFIMYNPTVYDVADIIDTYVYRQGIGQMNYSYSSAVGLFNSLVSMVLVLSSNAVAKKCFGYSMW